MTDEKPGPEYGRTEVLIELTGWLGRELTSPALIIEPDPGWMNGFGLQVGRHYFIPYVAGPDGLRSHVCDPIAELAPDEVPVLIEVARAAAWGHDAGLRGPSQAAGPAAGTETADARPWAWPLIALIVLGSVGAASAMRVRRDRAGSRPEAPL